LPGTNSFISEFLVLIGSYGREPAFTIIATVGMIMAALYVLWFYQRVMHGPVRGDALLGAVAGPGAVADPERTGKSTISDLNGREKAVLIPLVVLIVGIGIYPKPVLDVITPSVDATMTSVGLSDPVGGN
jgi:NADH-quinone oxidoreductase subunit M